MLTFSVVVLNDDNPPKTEVAVLICLCFNHVSSFKMNRFPNCGKYMQSQGKGEHGDLVFRCILSFKIIAEICRQNK